MVFDLAQHRGNTGKRFDVHTSKIVDPWLIGLIESFNHLPPRRIDDSLYMQGYKYGEIMGEPIAHEGGLTEDTENPLVKAEMTIPSSTVGMPPYKIVLMNDGFHTCKCKHWLWRLKGTRNPCKHIKKAISKYIESKKP